MIQGLWLGWNKHEAMKIMMCGWRLPPLWLHWLGVEVSRRMAACESGSVGGKRGALLSNARGLTAQFLQRTNQTHAVPGGKGAIPFLDGPATLCQAVGQASDGETCRNLEGKVRMTA
jgi:hypothetical protein